MSVTSIQKKAPPTGSWNLDGKREYSQKYLVVTDDVNDGPVAVLQQTGSGNLPTLNSVFSSGNDTDLGAFLKSRSCSLVSEDGSRKVWIVDCKWDTDLEDDSGNPDEEQVTEPEDPTTLPPDISWGFITSEKALEKDFLDTFIGQVGAAQAGQFILATGQAAENSAGQPVKRVSDAVCNTAGDPYDPPMTLTEYIMTLTVVKNVSQFNPAAARDLIGSVNSESIFGMNPYQIRCAGVSATRERNEQENVGTAGSTVFWQYDRVTFEFHVKGNGQYWFEPVVSKGFNQWDLDTLEKKKIKVKEKETTVALRLDADGVLITGKDPADTVYVPVYPYPARDWGALGLDELLPFSIGSP